MNRLKELRNQRKLTLDDIEENTGIKRGTYSNYENNKTEPKIETWQKLARYFKVSVPYIQGLTYTTDELIEIIHKFYFEGYEDNAIGTVQDEFSNEINIYIKVTSNDSIPRELYPKSTTDFSLNDKAKSYWLKHFKDILNSDEFHNMNKVEDEYADVHVITRIQEIIEIRIYRPELPHTYTELGKFYEKHFSMEKELHNRAIDAIKFLDLSLAKEAITEYTNLIVKIRDHVKLFKEDSFKAEAYNKETLQYIKQEIYMKYEPSKYEILDFSNTVDELLDRLSKGNQGLVQYILNNSKGDFFMAYRNYKKKIGEDTKKIDEIIDEYQENYRKATKLY